MRTSVKPVQAESLDLLRRAFLALALMAVGGLVWRMGTPSSSPFVLWSIIFVPAVMFVLKFDYLNPLLVFLLPWFVVTLFASMEVSRFARPLSEKTYRVLWGMEAAAIVSYYLAVQSKPKRSPRQEEAIKEGRYWTLVWIYAALTIFNVAAAGYVPLIRGIQTGDTDYLDFGVHSIFGFYNAFSNALGVLSFFVWMRTGRKAYLWVLLLIFTFFVLFVTRQNVMSMVVECAVVYCFVKGRISGTKIAAGVAVVAILFAVAGNLRSGNIKEIAGIKEEYQDLPDAMIWIYGYSYFNVLNLDNVITNPAVPFYDGSGVLALLPTVLRPTTSHTVDELEVEQFTVSSYVAPIYADVGFWGIVLFTGAVTWWGIRSYQRAMQDGSFYSIAKYSVLFLCALFSLFWNFWFYLPIIFEIPIFAGMSVYILVEKERKQAPAGA